MWCALSEFLTGLPFLVYCLNHFFINYAEIIFLCVGSQSAVHTQIAKSGHKSLVLAIGRVEWSQDIGYLESQSGAVLGMLDTAEIIFGILLA